MTILCTNGAPSRAGVAGDVFDFVKRILDVRFQVIARRDTLLAQRVTRINGKQRLHVQIFAPVEIFHQAETIRGPVIPRAAVSGPLRRLTDGFLPVETLVY